MISVRWDVSFRIGFELDVDAAGRVFSESLSGGFGRHAFAFLRPMS